MCFVYFEAYPHVQRFLLLSFAADAILALARFWYEVKLHNPIWVTFSSPQIVFFGR